MKVKIHDFVKKVFNFFIKLLIPPKCAFCGEFLVGNESKICRKCARDLSYIRGSEECFKVDFADAACSALWYEGRARQGVRYLKFYGRNSSVDVYSEYIVAAIRKNIPQDADVVTWVPTPYIRKRGRGYDHAELLAKSVAHSLGIPAKMLLDSAPFARPQADAKGYKERKARVIGRFHLKRNADVSGKKVLLVDDIITTGATVGECAKILKRGGASRVYAVSLSKARKKGGTHAEMGTITEEKS